MALSRTRRIRHTLRVTYPADPPGRQPAQYPGNYAPVQGNYPVHGQAAPPYPEYPPTRPGRLRGRRPIQAGVVLLVIGLALAITGGVIGAAGSLSKVNDFQRVAVSDQTGTVTFSHAGGYLAYYESASITRATDRVPLIHGVLTNQATGTKVTLQTTYGNLSDGKIRQLHYEYGGHKGLAMWQFHIDQPGTWQVQLNPGAPDADAVVAFGPSIARDVVAGAIIVVVGVLMLLGGLVTLIVGLVMRRRHKRELRTGAYGAVAPAGGGVWPSAGWPQPSAGWPQPSAGWPQPSAGWTQPSAGWTQPSAPDAGWPQPSAGWPQPSTPDAGWPQPSAGWTQPSTPDPGWTQQGWPPPGGGSRSGPP
jgi:hypothetical protein